MDYIWDAPVADVFICNGELDWHDYYYISPRPYSEDSLVYQLNRTGIESRTPEVFHVERGEHTPYCQIFCVMSGKGQVFYEGKRYSLHENQMVLLNGGKAHTYESNPKEPFGIVWMEFYGADSRKLMEHIIENQTPVLEGPVVAQISALIGSMQQRIMLNEWYQPALDIYEILLELLKNESSENMRRGKNTKQEWEYMLDVYIDAHIGEEISNQQMAQVCGLSLSYFSKQFKKVCRVTPQEYVMNRRITKAKYLLTQTKLPIEQVAERLCFCNASHLVRRFKEQEGITPAKYRKYYSVV